jgi:hypothetical protein
MSKSIELAKKLLALAEKGVGGEKVNAKKKLQEYLDKHGLTLDDIDGDKKEDHYFTVKPDQEKLFIQIGTKVIGRDVKIYAVYRNNRKARNKMVITCTAAHAAEITIMLETYWNAYQKELDLFYKAFIHKNDLGVEPEEGVKSNKETSLEELLKIKQMMSGIDRTSHLKRIEE